MKLGTRPQGESPYEELTPSTATKQHHPPRESGHIRRTCPTSLKAQAPQTDAIDVDALQDPRSLLLFDQRQPRFVRQNLQQLFTLVDDSCFETNQQLAILLYYNAIYGTDSYFQFYFGVPHTDILRFADATSLITRAQITSGVLDFVIHNVAPEGVKRRTVAILDTSQATTFYELGITQVNDKIKRARQQKLVSLEGVDTIAVPVFDGQDHWVCASISIDGEALIYNSIEGHNNDAISKRIFAVARGVSMTAAGPGWSMSKDITVQNAQYHQQAPDSNESSNRRTNRSTDPQVCQLAPWRTALGCIMDDWRTHRKATPSPTTHQKPTQDIAQKKLPYEPALRLLVPGNMQSAVWRCMYRNTLRPMSTPAAEKDDSGDEHDDDAAVSKRPPQVGENAGICIWGKNNYNNCVHIIQSMCIVPHAFPTQVPNQSLSRDSFYVKLRTLVNQAAVVILSSVRSGCKHNSISSFDQGQPRYVRKNFHGVQRPLPGSERKWVRACRLCGEFVLVLARVDVLCRERPRGEATGGSLAAFPE
ncbi:hypothetical protein CC86DRAFT_425824 [Ophiobolus disseminans]|uniref:Uncharacterized protein n=1 Tax=Ophiobolus disseminans TaxID=1469910 RepID=A0A6A6ZPN8_9PLEO|nr:hypothetical protein CC86DRAFT_425824 [Ophiobolus disseminans]